MIFRTLITTNFSVRLTWWLIKEINAGLSNTYTGKEKKPVDG